MTLTGFLTLAWVGGDRMRTDQTPAATIPVDFTFESVDGPGESLGCVRV